MALFGSTSRDDTGRRRDSGLIGVDHGSGAPIDITTGEEGGQDDWIQTGIVGIAIAFVGHQRTPRPRRRSRRRKVAESMCDAKTDVIPFEAVPATERSGVADRLAEQQQRDRDRHREQPDNSHGDDRPERGSQ